MGVLHELIRKELGVDTYLKINPLGGSFSSGRSKILQNNPDRVALMIVNLSSGSIYVLPDENVSVEYGILLEEGGGNVSLNYKEDFDIVGFDWWMFATVSPARVLVVEVIAR